MSSSVPSPPPSPAFIPPMCAVFRRYLKRQGLKFTKERAVTLDVVLELDGLFEADELLEKLQARGAKTSRATVYRTLKHLAESRIIQEEPVDHERMYYRVSFGREPVGHVIDVETGQAYSFSTAALAEALEAICKEHGLNPISHRVVVYGEKAGG